MSTRATFRQNFRKLLKEKGYSAQSFSIKSGLHRSKIQRLSDTSNDSLEAGIDLGDADRIAQALGTTLGYMCGNDFTDYMLDQTRIMYEYFCYREESRKHLRKVLEYEESEIAIKKYLAEILDKVDALGHKSK